MSPRSENFYLSGPNHRVSIDWSNVDDRRSVLASLVKGSNILERDRLEKRDEIQALAPPWWKFFHFELYHKFIDKTGSIIGAIYEYKYPSPVPNSPHYVFAFRGTILKKGTALRDIKSNFKCFLNILHWSSSFQEARKYVHKMVDEGARVWLAGHSLGSAMALLTGKEMAKMGHLLETYLFNPPFFSFPLEGVIKDERVKFIIRCFTSVFKKVLTALNDALNGGQAEDPFVVLSPWVPYLFVNPDDPICSEYIGYFKHREEMEKNGLRGIEMVATKNSTRNLCSSVLGMDSGSIPLHILPSAYLTINRGQFPDIEGVCDALKKFRRAHGLRQWWNSFPDEPIPYNYNPTKRC